MDIDHDPDEPKMDRDKSPFAYPWPLGFLVLVLLWAGMLYRSPFNYDWLILGLGTGIVVTAWFFDWHGTETPKSWRKTRR